MDQSITVGDTVRESGAELRMRVVDIRESDDGRMLADCQYQEPGHPQADADGNRVGPFVLAQLIKVTS